MAQFSQYLKISGRLEPGPEKLEQHLKGRSMMDVMKGALYSLLHGLWATLHLRACCEQTITQRLPGNLLPRVLYIGCTCGKVFYQHPECPRDLLGDALKD